MNEKFLHITNGSSAAELLEATKIGGDILTWDDALHDGPVPSGKDLGSLSEIRAKHIADGWLPIETVRKKFSERDQKLFKYKEFEEIVLWFEHDLYDQLQLIQVLEWFSQQNVKDGHVSLINPGKFLTFHSLEEIRSLFAERRMVTGAVLKIARDAWDAFRSPDPVDIMRFIEEEHQDLQYLNVALYRHLQQFPAVINGLSRSEMQALQAVVDGNDTPARAFRISHIEKEEAAFLGDWSFFDYLERMNQVQNPLIQFEDGSEIRVSEAINSPEEFVSIRFAHDFFVGVSLKI